MRMGSALARIRSWLARFASSPTAVWATVFVVYAAARLIIVLGGTVYQSSDSAVYAPRHDPLRDHGPLVSFVGNAPREWGLPAFYALFPSDEWRAVGQSVLATLAWAFFAWEASRHLRTRTARGAVAGGLLLFSCLSEVASWDLAILSESTSISLGLLVIAFLLRWLRTGSRAAVTAMSAIGVWWTFIRPDIRVFTVVLVAVLAGIAVAPRRGQIAALWWRWRGKASATVATRPAALGVRDRALPALVAALVLVAAIGWYAAITPRMQQAMVAYDHSALQPISQRSAEEIRVFRLRVDVSTDPEMWQAFQTELGMPTCPELETFRSTVAEWRQLEWTRAYLRCPALVAWVQARQNQNFWTELALKDPGLFVRKFSWEVSVNLGGEHYVQVPRLVPAPVEKLVFPSRRYGLPVVVAFFGVALGLALWAGARRAGGDLGRLFWAAIWIFGTALLSAVATIAVHTGELGRYGVQEAYGTRIAAILLLGCALDLWLFRRQQRAGAGIPQQRATVELEAAH